VSKQPLARYNLIEEKEMPKVIQVAAKPGFSLALSFEDGVTGIVDLSHFRHQGVFTIWEKAGVFEQARITDDGAIAWGDAIDICPDALYLEITGKRPEDIMPGLRSLPLHA